MTVKFGTDGIRGLAGVPPCTPEIARAIAFAVSRALRLGERSALIARDTRESGPALELGLVAGFADARVPVFSLGVLPTSGLAAVLRASSDVGAGVMLTASHNPAQDNGFKVLGPGGQKLTDAENAAIEAELVKAMAVARPPSTARVDYGAADRGAETWFEALDAAAGPSAAALIGRRIVVDLANGAVIAAVPWLDALPCEIIAIGRSGLINDHVGSEHPDALIAAVLEHGADAGLAVDGDGDRCRLVDETGQIIDGDALAWLLAVGRGVTKLAVTVMSSTALEEALPGVAIVRTPVGDRHLSQAIARGEATLGVEESGHVVFDDALPTGDGLVTGFRALAAAFGLGPSLSTAIAFEPFPRRLTKVRVRERTPIDAIPALVAAANKGETALGAHGRVFLRYSGTEPVLRILVEGHDADAVAAVSERVTRLAAEVLA